MLPLSARQHKSMCDIVAEDDTMKTLYNNTQTKEWMEGYPIGNGRLASMVWGDEKKDILSLNHEGLWRGIYREKRMENVSEHLGEVRNVFEDGDCGRGTELAVKYFGSDKTNFPVDSYQPAGDLIFFPADEYDFISRELDMKNAVAAVNRDKLKSEFYVDCVKDVIVGKWISNEQFGGVLSFNRRNDNGAGYKWSVTQSEIRFFCSFEGGISYSVTIEVETDGKVTCRGNSLFIDNAAYLNTKTNIEVQTDSIDDETVVPEYDYEADKILHAKKFSSYMNRVELKLSGSDELGNLTVKKRIEKVRCGEDDIGIAELYFNYGRYLMISCSVCARLPANLQGKWNDMTEPPWGSDYHFDINLQMCYWMCEAADIPECIDPLVNFLMRYMKAGADAAKKCYGCRGILLPLADDVWSQATPTGGCYGIWIGAAAWMAQHLWMRYIYSGCSVFLKNKAYPYFRAVAEFYEDYLTEDENGILQVIPSQSPENRFEGATRYDVSLCVSSAMDVQLAYDTLGYAIYSAQILNTDTDKVILWNRMRDKLPDFKIGEDGRLLEWNEEKTEAEPGHRHLSHLYGIYPSDIFMKKERIRQYNAAKKSLNFRLLHGGGHTGWSRAWVSCLYARFGCSDKFYENFKGLVKDFATVSLLDLHPPGIFQIDGNFGAVAAITEAIISSYDNKVHLLSAVPKQWKSGSLCGIKVPGGHKLDVFWQNGEVKKVKIVFGFKKSVILAAGGEEKEYFGKSGEVFEITN